MAQIEAYLNFTVGDLLAATDTQMLTAVIQSFQVITGFNWFVTEKI